MANCQSQPEGRSHSQQSSVRWWSTYKWGWGTTSVCFPSYLQSAPPTSKLVDSILSPIELYQAISKYLHYALFCLSYQVFLTFPKSTFPYQSHIRLSSPVFFSWVSHFPHAVHGHWAPRPRVWRTKVWAKAFSAARRRTRTAFVHDWWSLGLGI